MSRHAVGVVVAHFGKRVDSARGQYRQFVADGLGMGEQPHLVCKHSKQQDSGTDAVVSDSRVLGNSDFFQTLCEQNDFKGRLQNRKPLDELQQIVEDFFEVKPGGLGRRGRQDSISVARAVYCFLAVVKSHYPGVEVGRILGICGPSVSRAVRRGEELFYSMVDLQVWWDGS